MKYIKIILITVLLTGCARSGYKQFYTPYIDATILTDVELLAKGKDPQIFGTDNFEKDIQILRSKNYIPIGHSSFNGGYEDTKNAASQAKRIGATIVLINSQYTNTQTRTSTLFLPDNKTTYHSGTANSNTTYQNSYSGHLGNSSTNTGYSGTSITYGIKAVPHTTYKRRYDQNAVYFIKSTKKLRFGVYVNDLSLDQRIDLERNTGAFINVVIEDSPAFYSNVMMGDVLIAIDGTSVKNANHALELMRNVSNAATSSDFTVIRNGVEKKINIQF